MYLSELDISGQYSNSIQVYVVVIHVVPGSLIVDRVAVSFRFAELDRNACATGSGW